MPYSGGREVKNRKMREWRSLRTAAGRCYCGKPAENGKTHCQNCLDRFLVQRNARVANGICRCGKEEPAPNRKRCQQCLDAEHRRRRELKAELIAAYGGACTCCGCTIFEFLTIDHIFNNGRQERELVGAGFRFYSSLKKRGFPKEGHQLHCWNCNSAKYMHHVCPHVSMRKAA